MIHFVIGTRAQLFKMAPIMQVCEHRNLKWRWVYAAQHKETMEATLDFFGLPPPAYTIVKWDSEAKTISKFAYWFFKMLLALFKTKRILAGYTGKRHILLTHGDTTTAFLGAIMGRVARTHVMHVESGLRSFKLFNPFPEEINRLITFRFADYFACPDETALKNVTKYKGVKFDTHGNTQVDVLRYGLANLDKADIVLPKRPYVVLSSHRYENITNKARFEQIIGFAEQAAHNMVVLMPQHPATRIAIDKLGLRQRLEGNKNIVLLPRLEYQNYLKAIVNAEYVMSDGGGNQEELSYLGKPTLVLRDYSERQEGLGQNAVLSKLDPAVAADFMKNYKKYERPRQLNKVSPTDNIVDVIRSFG